MVRSSLGLLICVLLAAVTGQAQKRTDKLLEEHRFVNPEGKEQSLAAIIEMHRGKVIYLDFWASWCRPCRKELPVSLQLQEQFETKDIVFIYLSIDDVSKSWERVMQKEGLSNTQQNWRRGRKKSKELLKFFYIYSIPHYMIIGRNGQIVNRDALPPSDPRTIRQLRKWIHKKHQP